MNTMIGYGLTAMFYLTLGAMVVILGVLPAVDIAKEIIREIIREMREK